MQLNTRWLLLINRKFKSFFAFTYYNIKGYNVYIKKFQKFRLRANCMSEFNFCRECGSKLAVGSKFCNNCGAKVPDTETTGQQMQQQAQQYRQQPQYNYQPGHPKKSGKTVIGIIAGILAIFILITLFTDNDDKPDIKPTNNIVNTTTTVSVNTNANSTDKSGKASYTFLVYMNGSDLESSYIEGYGYSSAGTDDIVEMAAVGSDNNLNIVIETGGTKLWANEVIDPEQNQRWLVGKEEILNLGDLGKKNIGDPDTLKDFIVWSVQNYPADKYVLDFWNHGGGPLYGFGSDEHHQITENGQELNDGLTVQEIEKALSEAKSITGVDFEIIGFDACLMASIEVAEAVKEYGKYLVASEETEPGHGWNYTPVMNAIKNNPGIDGASLGKVIADGFKAQAETYKTDELITLSVVDLKAVDNIVNKLNNLCRGLSVDLVDIQTFNSVSYSRSRAESYGANNPSEGYMEIIDLYDFASTLEGEFQDEAVSLMDAIENAVVYRINGTSRLYGRGLSIFLPYMDKYSMNENLTKYDRLDFSNDYEFFINEYAYHLQADQQGIIFEDSLPKQMDDGSYTVVIDEVDRGNVNGVYNIVGMLLDDLGSMVTLGMDNNVFYDYDTGLVQDNFDGWWTSLNGEFITLFITEETEDYNMYTIPALVNGIDMDIYAIWWWDETYETGGFYEIIGGWMGLDESSFMADRNWVEIVAGDEITPYYLIYDAESDIEEFMLGDPFVLEEYPYLDFTALPTGEEYYYAFYITDFAQNEIYSDFIIFELTE
jgi:hypothetical protein